MRSNLGLGTNGIIADTRKEGSLPRLAPASVARATERLPRRKTLEEAKRYPDKGSVASIGCNGYVQLLLICFVFLLSTHSFMYAPLYKKYVKTQQLPEGSTMAASAPHLSKGKGKGKHQRQNK
jgi:hypothetical protein